MESTFSSHTVLLPWLTAALLLVTPTKSHAISTCVSESSQNASNLAFRMLDSNTARGQGSGISAAATGLIELSIYQQAVREGIAATNSTYQRQQWQAQLQTGVDSAAAVLGNSTEDVGLPLDRFSLGSSLLIAQQESSTGNASSTASVNAAIAALELSAAEQQRNANGGLWYYADPANLAYYHNLSYLDGMFSYSPFAVLASASTPAENVTAETQGSSDCSSSLGALAALEQLELLYNITNRPSGLLVHGYDASKAHNWSNPLTGASPSVWGRSLAWYGLGLLNTLELLHEQTANNSDTNRDSPASVTQTTIRTKMQNLLNKVLLPQIAAAEHSYNLTGSYGVWQVVDHPGQTGNFVEASASCMTVYTLLRSARLHLLTSSAARAQAVTVAQGIYNNVLSEFLTEANNRTLSLSGTSSVATLSVEDVGYDVSTIPQTVPWLLLLVADRLEG